VGILIYFCRLNKGVPSPFSSAGKINDRFMMGNSTHDMPHDVHAVEGDVEMYDKEAVHVSHS
jgi:hypothetical protein